MSVKRKWFVWRKHHLAASSSRLSNYKLFCWKTSNWWMPENFLFSRRWEGQGSIGGQEGIRPPLTTAPAEAFPSGGQGSSSFSCLAPSATSWRHTSQGHAEVKTLSLSLSLSLCGTMLRMPSNGSIMHSPGWLSWGTGEHRPPVMCNMHIYVAVIQNMQNVNSKRATVD